MNGGNCNCPKGGFRINAFGGPASTPWSTGPRPSTEPVATPGCDFIPLFAECFTGCDGPGNCGWVVLTPPGTAVFDGQQVFMGSSGGDNEGLIAHPFIAPSATGITFRFEFSQVASPPTANIFYGAGTFDALGEAIHLVQLGGDGVLVVDVSGTFYTGSWSPSSGATVVVHLTVDAVGTPSVFVDGISIPLTFAGVGSVTSVPDTVEATIFNDDFTGQGAFDEIFFAVGEFPPSTIFCCPEEAP